MRDTELDAFDLKILAEVQEDARRTAEKIGEAVSLSGAAVQRRLKRLRRIGAIRRDVALLDPALLGGRVTLIVSVRLTYGHQDTVDGFKSDMRRLPEVQQCYHTMGEADFMMIVTARSIEAYEAFTRSVFVENPNIAHFTSSLAMSTVKAGLAYEV